MASKTDPRTINMKVEFVDGKVILNEADFHRLLSHVTGREVKLETSLSLRPKAKRGPKAKPVS